MLQWRSETMPIFNELPPILEVPRDAKDHSPQRHQDHKAEIHNNTYLYNLDSFVVKISSYSAPIAARCPNNRRGAESAREKQGQPSAPVLYRSESRHSAVLIST